MMKRDVWNDIIGGIHVIYLHKLHYMYTQTIDFQ